VIKTWIMFAVLTICLLLGPVVQKPINAKLGLNLLNLGLNFNPRLLCVVQSYVILNPLLKKQGLNLTLLARWVNLLIGRLTRIQNGRRRSEKRKHVKLLVKQTVYKYFMEENQPQKVNSKSINTIKILIRPV
jgi:hypothetical protein